MMEPRAGRWNMKLRLCIALTMSVVLLSAVISVAETSSSTLNYVPNEYIIHVMSGTNYSAVEQLVDNMGASIISALPLSDTYHIKLGANGSITSKQRYAMSSKWVIDHIQPNYVKRAMAEPDDAYYSKQWDMEMINMPDAWELQTGSSDVTVAVVDSGVADHPELVGRKITGYDFIDDDDDPSNDGAGHGTHVAGTIAAQGDNGEGICGICWDNVKVMPVRVLDDDGGGTTAIAIEGLDYALDNGADVVNMSYGGYGDDEDEHAKLQELDDAGIILVAAAGNEATSLKSYPAAFEEVIAVSAVGPDESLAYYSNYGSWIDIAAPGGDLSSGDDADGIWSTTVTWADDSSTATYGYESWQGTSMACPHVAGAAALMLSNGFLPEKVRDRLLDSARIPSSGYSESKYGAGILDVAQALAYASIKIKQPYPGATVGTNPVVKISLDSIDASTVVVYLDYTDIDDNGVPDDLSDTSSMIVTSSNVSNYTNSAGTLLTIDDLSSLSVGEHKIYVQGGSTTSGTGYSDWVAFNVVATTFSSGIQLVSLPYDFATLGSDGNVSMSVLPSDLFLTTDGEAMNFKVSGTTKASLIRWVAKSSFAAKSSGYYTYPTSNLAWSNPFVTTTSAEWYTGGGFIGGVSSAYAFPAGSGFWIQLPENAVLNEAYNKSPYLVSSDAEFSMNLYTGWNMFGNPYTKEVSWSNALFSYGGEVKTLAGAQSAGWVKSNVYYYVQTPTGAYHKLTNRGLLEPYVGYWIYAKVGGVDSGKSLVMTILP
ncbi:MAG: S8 family peptidase [Armatimonadota bacterium]|nr:S8 family peptidase [bacterium]